MMKIFVVFFVALLLFSTCPNDIVLFLVKGQSGSTTLLFEPRVIKTAYLEESSVAMIVKVTVSVINVYNLKKIHLVMRFNDTMTQFTYYAEWGNLSLQVGGTSGIGSKGTDPSYIKRFDAELTSAVSGSGSLVIFYLQPLRPGSSQLILLESDLRDSSNNSIQHTVSQNTVTIEVASLEAWVDGKYSDLKVEFDSLSANYAMLEENFSSLSGAYDGLYSNYTELKGSYDSLNATYIGLEGNVSVLIGVYGSLISNYTTLKANFDALYSNYEPLLNNLNKTINDLNQTKNMMYVFVITTMIFAVFFIYILTRRKIR
jgi:hypothetical protein